MKYFSVIILTFCIGAVWFAPVSALAQSGLVVCEGPECNFCHITSFVNGAINWLIGILAVVAVAVFVYAGFRLVTSGGDASAVSFFKERLINIVIGFILVLTAWLIVDTILKNTTNKGGLELWGIVNCGSQTAPQDRKYGDLSFDSVTILDEVEGWSPGPNTSTGLATREADCEEVTTGATGRDRFNCDEQIALCEEAGGVATINSAANTVSCKTDPRIINPEVVVTDFCAPLTPLSGDAERFENGPKIVYPNDGGRLRACAAGLGGSVTSAYRPAAYQRHLKEVHTKWCGENGLQSSAGNACPAVKNEVQAEMDKHGLSCSRPVATNSNHSSKISVDVSGGPEGSPATRNACFKWFGPGDPVHYTLISGCSCQ